MLSVFGMGDHHIEVSTVEASGGQSSEIFIIFDHEVFQKLGGYICIVASKEEVVLGIEIDHVSIGLRRALLGSLLWTSCCSRLKRYTS